MLVRLFFSLIFSVSLLTPPAPPVLMQAVHGEGRILLVWTQQSDATTVCIDQVSGGASTAHGCFNSAYGPRTVDLPLAPDGTSYFLHEWRHKTDDTWVSYGIYGPVPLPVRIWLPLVRH